MKYNYIGIIKEGIYKNWNVMYEFDKDNTNGFYLYIWNNNEGFDEWFESENDLLGYLSELDINWTKERKSFLK